MGLFTLPGPGCDYDRARAGEADGRTRLAPTDGMSPERSVHEKEG